MTDKPLDTPFTEFTAEEVEAMDDDEVMNRAIHTAGDVGDMMEGIALEAAQEILYVIQQGAALVLADTLEDEDAEEFLTVRMSESIHAAVVAAMQIARRLETFVAANPEFPDSEPRLIATMLEIERAESEAHDAEQVAEPV